MTKNQTVAEKTQEQLAKLATAHPKEWKRVQYGLLSFSEFVRLTTGR